MIWSRNFRDLDGALVNEKGYLINEVNGGIRSKYSFEDMFIPETSALKDLGELPMPYRLERYNFNPHRIIGDFEYEFKAEYPSGRPVFLKDKFEVYTDKHYRPINEAGYLINE